MTTKDKQEVAKIVESVLEAVEPWIQAITTNHSPASVVMARKATAAKLVELARKIEGQ